MAKVVYCRKCGAAGYIPDGQGKTAGKAGLVGGAAAGGWLGSSVGLAGAFGAASGLLPAALIGAWVGRKVLKKLTAPSCKKCGAGLE